MADVVTGNVVTVLLDNALPIPGERAVREPVIYFITKASAAALTIVAPVAGQDDGKQVIVVSSTAAAHVLTSATDGFNAKGSSGTATWAANKGGVLYLIAMNGHWWTQQAIAGGVTIA